MEIDMKILGFIPARAGSQRIKNKNIKLLGRKPLIYYTICAAKKSKFINRIVVSTDTAAISEIAKQYNAEVPFLRPSEISKNDSTEMEFLIHALDWLEKIDNYIPDLIVLLYPTAPFRRSKTIDEAISLIIEHPNADSLRSIRLCKEHPYKMWEIRGNYLYPFIKDEDPNIHTSSYQVLPEVYIQNANIYITKPSTIKNKKTPTGTIIIPFVMNEIESIDINSPLDFDLAEMVIGEK